MGAGWGGAAPAGGETGAGSDAAATRRMMTRWIHSSGVMPSRRAALSARVRVSASRSSRLKVGLVFIIESGARYRPFVAARRGD